MNGFVGVVENKFLDLLPGQKMTFSVPKIVQNPETAFNHIGAVEVHRYCAHVHVIITK